ncbi:hypothetical protein M9458_042329, partial [Cirrhinus mrigala]
SSVEMEASTNGSSFGIDSLLSHRPGSPVIAKGDSLVGECRSPLEKRLFFSSVPAAGVRVIRSDSRPICSTARSPLDRNLGLNGQPTQETGRLASKIADDFIEKIHSNSSSDSEYK